MKGASRFERALVDLTTARDCSPIEHPEELFITGSTGSIGKSTLSLVRDYPKHFKVNALSAHQNWQLLLEQINEFKPEMAFLTQEEAYQRLKCSYSGRCKIYYGIDAISERAAEQRNERFVAAMVGMIGLGPLLSALSAGKTVALANKESIVVAGALVSTYLQKYHGKIIPVDSEHSSLYQLLLKQRTCDVEKLILTASGGPFWRLPIEEFKNITPQQAIKHPRWSMGPKISVDSATLVNKALELAEACWLFGYQPQDVEVLIHPESIVHAMIKLRDGSQLAHLSVPDMRAAIAFSLIFPAARLEAVLPPPQYHQLNFQELDDIKFPALRLMREALNTKKEIAYNIANEICVEKFLKGDLPFSLIVPTIEAVLSKIDSFTLQDIRQIPEYQEYILKIGEF